MISQVSILVPFGLGAAVGPWRHETLGLEGRALPFSLFVGVAMAITAFPVLARILQEVGLAGTPLGSLALTCAAVDDVTAWCALAVIAGVSGASGSTGWSGAAGMLAATVGFAGVMFLVVRPLARRMRPSIVVMVVIAVAAAAVTEWIGLHSIFGGFLAGVALGGRPERREPERREGVASVEPVVTNVLLPAFFVVVGSSVAISELDRPERWLVLAVVLLVAVVGKLGGTAAAALALGEERRAAWTLGVLLNTRGLTEIVMLSVGLDLGIIDETVFTIMVVMALVTTFAAGPLLRRRSASSGSGRSGFGPVRVP
ncbi:MAG: cation:proton antiporter [Actinobacteria bacterium]|nr:cation:proton antiporter [Actinomycetota bacterium]